MATIDTIEEWNARLSPPLADDSDAEPGDCGCCEMPRCCPPQLQCQSLTAVFYRQGEIKPDTSYSDSIPDTTLFLRYGTTVTYLGTYSEDNAPLTSGDCGYSKTDYAANATYFFGFEHTRSYYGSIGTGPGSDSDSTGCPEYPYEKPTVCEASGYSEISNYFTHCYGDPPQTKVYDRTSYYKYVISNAEGETTPAFAAWRLEFPTDGDYDAAVAAYEAYLVAYAAWTDAYNAWIACEAETPGECGAEPVEPTLVTEPTPRPEMEVFPACWWKITTQITIDPHYFGYNFDGSSADSPDPTAFATWIEGGASGTPPSSGYGELYDYTQSPISAIAVTGISSTSEETYETPVTLEEWKADVAAVISAADFPHAGCMSDLCGASRDIVVPENLVGNESYTETVFRYRWKLNKCCGLYSALTWLEVFFSEAFLDWLANLTGSDSVDFPAPDTPTVTTKAWEWTGVSRPTECDNSDSTDSVIGPSDTGFNAFDDETRWSPWSLKVEVPAGEEGQVLLRSLYMTCYRSDYGTKPDRIDLYTEYNQSDLDNDGQPDP